MAIFKARTAVAPHPHFKPSRFPVLVGFFLLRFLLAGNAMAIDIIPQDYVPAPSGTNLTGLYYLFGQYGQLNLSGIGTFKNSTNLQSNLGVFRQIRYGDFGGRAWSLQLVVPFGRADGEIAGNKLQGSSGVGDMLVSAGVSFLPHPDPRYNIGIVLYTSLPTGDYRPTRTLNLGANRFGFDAQIGYTQAIGDKFWFDAAIDGIFYTVNNDAGPNHRLLSQRPTGQLQLWFGYKPDALSLVSVGYAAQTGGSQRIDGVATGAKTESQQVRVAYQRFLTASFQLATVLSRDIVVTGGFKETFGATVRAIYLY